MQMRRDCRDRTFISGSAGSNVAIEAPASRPYLPKQRAQGLMSGMSGWDVRFGCPIGSFASKGRETVKRMLPLIAPLVLTAGFAPLQAAAEESVEFRDGDRVVWIGGTFVERMQRYG